MRYRGYEIRGGERTIPGVGMARDIGIHRGGKTLAWVADRDLARRVIDQKIREGTWADDAAGGEVMKVADGTGEAG